MGKLGKFMEYINLPMVLVLVGAFISASGAWLANYRQNQEKIEAAQQQSEFQKQLREKSEENAVLSRQIAATITGGDSYVFIKPANLSDEGVFFGLQHVGKYPVYDLSVEVFDFEKNDKIPVSERATLQGRAKAIEEFNIGNMGVNKYHLLRAFKLSNKDKHYFNIFIQARNFSITENLRFRRVGEEWQFAIKVTRNDDDKVLLVEASEKYPRNQDGVILWEE